MPIEEPRINVALTNNSGRVSILIRRSDADDAKPDELPRWISWQLGTIEHAGYMAACERIGNAVLRLLHQPHAVLFAQHPLLAPPDDLSELDRLTDLINNLISRSAAESTSAYVPALDAIFTRHAAELAQTDLPGQWPTFREAFLRHGGPT
jgi:hypothetical protein